MYNQMHDLQGFEDNELFLNNSEIPIPNSSTHLTLTSTTQVDQTSFDFLSHTSPYLENFPRPIRKPVKRFRKRTKSKYPCDLFLTTRNSIPKLEYLRCKLIRGIKRICRNIRHGRVPELTLHMVNLNNPLSLRAFQVLENLYTEFGHNIQTLIETENGPLTDGISRRTTVNSETQKSFNFNFCKSFYSHEEMVVFHHYYIELVFAEPDPKILNKKLNIRCCSGSHETSCYKKWEKMKEYLENNFVREFGVEPYKDEVPLELRDFEEEEEEKISEHSTGSTSGFENRQPFGESPKENTTDSYGEYINTLTNFTEPEDFLAL